MKKPFPLPTSLALITLPGLLVLVSCEPAKKLLSSFRKETPPIPATAHSGPLVSEIPDGGYDTFPLQRGRVVIVDFHADWCGPCRQLGPILEKIANEKNGLVLVGKVNIDKHKALAAREGVQGIPDVRIYRDGSLVDKFIGLPPDEVVRQKIETQLKGLPPLAQNSDAGPKNNGPTVAPMTKDWLPPGMSRR